MHQLTRNSLAEPSPMGATDSYFDQVNAKLGSIDSLCSALEDRLQLVLRGAECPLGQVTQVPLTAQCGLHHRLEEVIDRLDRIQFNLEKTYERVVL